jgi:hypothetical protein
MTQIPPQIRLPRRWLTARLRTRHLGALAIVVVLGAFELLNLTNFCYRDTRFLGENELISAAIKLNIARFDSQGERKKAYTSVSDFMSQNPNCCKLYYNNDLMYVTFLGRLIGIREVVVNVYYKMSDTADIYKFYDSFVKMNSCGDVLDAKGIPEQSGPAG